MVFLIVRCERGRAETTRERERDVYSVCGERLVCDLPFVCALSERPESAALRVFPHQTVCGDHGCDTATRIEAGSGRLESPLVCLDDRRDRLNDERSDLTDRAKCRETEA